MLNGSCIYAHVQLVLDPLLVSLYWFVLSGNYIKKSKDQNQKKQDVNEDDHKTIDVKDRKSDDYDSRYADSDGNQKDDSNTYNQSVDSNENTDTHEVNELEFWEYICS